MKLFVTFGAVAAALTLASPAQAALLDFVITGDGYNAVFQLDSAPLVDPANVYPDYGFALAEVPFAGWSNGLADVMFFAGSVGGGLLFVDNGDHFTYLFDAASKQIYGGTEALPTFAPGIFSLEGLGTRGAFTLTVSNAVPEPATWALMIAGFGLTAAALRRKRQAVSVRYTAA